LLGALGKQSKEEILSAFFCLSSDPDYWQRHALSPAIAEIANGSFKQKEPPEIIGGRFVVRSLEAALWAFHRSDSFREGALRAVNLGDDADTTGAIYGQLAGAYYGSRLSHRSGSSAWRCANSSAKRPPRCSTSRTHNAIVGFNCCLKLSQPEIVPSELTQQVKPYV